MLLNAVATAVDATKRPRDMLFMSRGLALYRAKPRVRALVVEHARKLAAKPTELQVVAAELSHDSRSVFVLSHLAALDHAADPRGEIDHASQNPTVCGVDLDLHNFTGAASMSSSSAAPAGIIGHTFSCG